ncbi:MAG: ROK family protein [Chloroflexi bacterium]|nr:ROK family protein [Chloroflexota bacterium]
MTETNSLGRNVSLVKEHNLRALLLRLLSEGALSRIQLAEKTSLSATAITNLVDDLYKQGIVRECNSKQFVAERRVGRPRAKLCLVPDARYVLGVQMRVGVFRVALANLLGELVDYTETPFSNETPAFDVIQCVAEKIETLIASHQIKRRKILGIGVGASGLVDYHTGVNLLAANFGWRDVPIHEWLHARLKLPIVVDNNVRCMALGEAMFGAGRGVRSLVFVYGRFGVGAGIVMNSQVLRGSGLGAGEIGHTIVMPRDGLMCRCGQRGCLETLVSEPSLAQSAGDLVCANPASQLATIWHTETSVRPIKRLYLAARAGDPLAKQLVETSANYLGLALTNLVNLINPELILLGGLFSDEADVILPIAKATMQATAFGGMGQQARLQATTFGWQAGMVGAAALALAKYLYLNPEEV